MKRNKFSLSHYLPATLNMGDVAPIGITEVLPGDSIQHATSALIRTAPLNAPVMHPVHAKIHHWFVPHRLVWEDWEDFITGGPDGASLPVFPTIEFDSVAAGSLANLLGIPVFSAEAENVNVSAIPFRAYAAICNEYYRDQDLVDPVGLDITSGPDTTTNTDLFTAAWEKDYLTSARPFTQKGPAITIPIGDQAPVTGIGLAPAADPTNGTFTAKTTQGSATFGTDGGYFDTPTDGSIRIDATGSTSGANPKIYADLSAVTGIDVNELRLALALQRYEEARARYGSRYVEYLRYLGVKSSDSRLQRPEYLGGGKQTIQFSEVLQTAQGTDPVGTMRGHGIAAMRSNRYRRFFEEHGYVISCMVVRPIAVYAQGIPRHFNRRTKEDFWQRELQHIGQQEILNKEVYVGAAQPDGIFGYNDRYDEYRRGLNRVAGEFATILDEWNLARKFSAEPALNDDFVNCVPDPRIFQSTATDQLYCMIAHSMQARRLVDKSGTSYIY